MSDIENAIIAYITESGTADNRIKDIADCIDEWHWRDVTKCVEGLLARGVLEGDADSYVWRAT